MFMTWKYKEWCISSVFCSRVSVSHYPGTRYPIPHHIKIQGQKQLWPWTQTFRAVMVQERIGHSKDHPQDFSFDVLGLGFC